MKTQIISLSAVASAKADHNSPRTLISRRSAVVLLALGCVVFLPGAQAVLPAPDGGYPGQNTAEGQSALLHLAGGTYNTALGWASLGFDITGNFNTAVGAAALLNNTADENTATGTGALLSNSTGGGNTANGAFALFSNTTGEDNTAAGTKALFSNMRGHNNTATGVNALFNNTTGSGNTASGRSALFQNTSGGDNTASGVAALFSNTMGSFNTATGFDALLNNTTGTDNTATGFGALQNNTIGNGNTANGNDALKNNTGGGNTANGHGALAGNTTGNYNIALGAGAGGSVTTASGVICIGAFGENVSNSCYIGRIFDSTSSGGTAVFINQDGKLGTTTSSRRFKEEIKPMESASEALFALKPVAFYYKKEIDPGRVPQFGLVAEDVEKVNPDLVVRDQEGKPYSVRYEQINAMLLNEFLKEHRKGEQQDRKIEGLETTVAQLQSVLKEQAARIEKVSDQLAVSKSAPQIVLGNQ